MIQFEFVLILVMVSILFAGDVVSMGHLSYSLAVIPTPKSMIRCDAPSLVSLDSHSSGYNNFSFEIDRLYHGRVIDSTLDVSKLRQISQTQIWDPGSSSREIGEEDMKSRSDYIHKVCLVLYLTLPSVYFFNKQTTIFSEVGVFFVTALEFGDDATRTRIKRSFQQHIWIYGTITTTYISFFRSVPTSKGLRCNGWITAFDFRKRKRWCIDKKKMFPKLENHTRWNDKMKAIKYIIRIAAPELLCFFVTTLYDCIHSFVLNIVIFDSS